MTPKLATVAGIIFLSTVTFAQSTVKPAGFESADVHVSPPSTLAQMSGGVLRSGRYELRNATMVDLIRTAYGVTDDKVVGGPSWLATDRFDVIAKTSAAATADVAKL